MILMIEIATGVVLGLLVYTQFDWIVGMLAKGLSGIIPALVWICLLSVVAGLVYIAYAYPAWRTGIVGACLGTAVALAWKARRPPAA